MAIMRTIRYRSPHINRIVVCLGGANPCASETALSYHVPTKQESIDESNDYERRFKNIASEYPQLETTFDVAEATKDIRDTLMEYCSETEPDLVAIGSGGSTHYLKLASLVEYVVRESPCDVLILRENEAASTSTPNESDDEDNGDVAEFAEAGTASIEDILMGDLKEVMDEHKADDELIFSAKVLQASPLPAAAMCEYAQRENVDIIATGYGGHSHLFHPNSFP
ncbi:hypothetical protein Pmar_PMAR024017 [Perkinsus marinus ATCC 50983]|uniref:UspA domain-containing protein n=1 Tax=Perkinsus marinus (strain ATCC 50983 / TXsc) TaxID=423536 RepID=C5L6F2_PERM5|nr:hypothetical protein Pmar_PMAR024017 [Perkinsus marinus ATCC 50983]EER07613.1 hypothetical protein Pmar_PMAR024017 [Perkinsus marinus ATCC 50983]|eukprot:XP_002775797.1 hypothetical protein Pmar_PMAR024017 [Perkinsus marinus ATCC 50983]